LIASQPLHLVSIILGLPALDLCAWSATALGMAWLAATLPTKDADRDPASPLVTSSATPARVA
jgi:hypothetical protein